MGAIFDIVLPVFLLIGLGYLTAVSRLLDSHTGDGLAAFVFNIAIPILLMRALATSEFSSVGAPAYWASYFFGVATVWIAATVLIVGLLKRGHRAAVIAGVAAGFSNLVLMGIPLIQQAFGDNGLTVLLLLIAVHLPIMMTVSTFLMEYAVRADGVEDSPLRADKIALNLTRNLVKNPIIIGIAAGALIRVSGINMGGPVATVIELIGRTAGPLALFSLGMGLIKYGIRGNLLPAAGLTVLSLLVLPACVYWAGTAVFSLSDLWLNVAVLAAACPTGVNAYLFAIHFKVAEGLAANSIVLATAGSVVTVPLWLIFLLQ